MILSTYAREPRIVKRTSHFYYESMGLRMNRLFEIMYILLDKRTTTAKELAQHFEVSVRTIYRDIDALSSAGVPIYTTQGKNGGISILDSHVLNNAMISEEEQRKILSALQSQQELESEETAAIISKLSGLFHVSHPNWVSIDFSDWSGQRQGLFILVKQCILNRKLLRFNYYNRYGEMTTRIVEPMQLWFKGKTWYLRAYCRNKQAMRIFKLTRMKEAELLEESFAAREFMDENKEPSTTSSGSIITLIMWIDGTQTFRIYDDFEEQEIIRNEDGSYTVTVRFVEDEWVYGMILSYGHYAKVLAPDYLRDTISNYIKKMAENYQ